MTRPMFLDRRLLTRAVVGAKSFQTEWNTRAIYLCIMACSEMF